VERYKQFRAFRPFRSIGGANLSSSESPDVRVGNGRGIVHAEQEEIISYCNTAAALVASQQAWQNMPSVYRMEELRAHDAVKAQAQAQEAARVGGGIGRWVARRVSLSTTASTSSEVRVRAPSELSTHVEPWSRISSAPSRAISSASVGSGKLLKLQSAVLVSPSASESPLSLPSQHHDVPVTSCYFDDGVGLHIPALGGALPEVKNPNAVDDTFVENRPSAKSSLYVSDVQTPQNHSGLKQLRLVTDSAAQPKPDFIGGCKPPASKHEVLENGSLYGNFPDWLAATESAESITLEEWLVKVLEPNQLRLSLLPGSFLQDVNRIVRSAMAHAAASSVFHTSTPLIAVASKPRYQVLLLWLFAFYTLIGAVTLALACGTSLGSVRRLRFIALALRGGGDPAVLGPGITNIGLLRNGCPVESTFFESTFQKDNTTKDNTTILEGVLTIDLSAKFNDANGWYLVTGNEHSELDPVRFVLERSAEANGNKWYPVGASRWIFNDLGVIKLLDGAFDGQEWPRDDTVLFDMRPAAAWIMAWPAADFVFAAAMAVSFVQALRGRYSIAVQIFLGAFIADACLYFAAAAVHSINNSQSAFVCWTYGAGCVGLASVGWLRQRAFVLAILIHGVWQFFLTAINVSSLVFGDTSALIYTPLTTGVVEAMLGIVVLLMRAHIIRRSVLLIESDRRLYDCLWQQMLAGPHMAGSLQSLAEAVNHCYTTRMSYIVNSVDMKPASTCEASVAASSFTVLGWARCGSCQLTKDLDQLYAQAAGVDLLLRRKILQWVRVTDALLEINHSDIQNPTESTSSEGLSALPPDDDRSRMGLDGDQQMLQVSQTEPIYAGWVDLARDPDLLGRIRWAHLKRIDRATEKVLRTYRGDASRLGDIARQTLVFDSLNDLTKCLGVLEADPDVWLVAVKNRYKAEYTAEVTAGFRNVAISLCIISPIAVEYGMSPSHCMLHLKLQIALEVLIQDLMHLIVSHYFYLVFCSTVVIVIGCKLCNLEFLLANI